MLRANFYERLKTASSYLGLVALHTLIVAMARFYDLGPVSPKICCDNISALRQSSWRKGRVKTGASQADVLRVLRTIRHEQLLKPTYEHVYWHQYQKTLWWNLPLIAQLNCVCNGLAKTAVSRSLLSVLPRPEQYLLPLEHAAVFVQEEKSTTDVSAAEARCF